MRRQLAPLWQDAKRRAGIDSSSSSLCATRELKKNRVFSIIQQFYASVTWNDEHTVTHDDVTTFRCVSEIAGICEKHLDVACKSGFKKY